MMVRSLLPLLVSILLFTAGCRTETAEPSVVMPIGTEVGNQAPDFTQQTPEGTPVSLRQFRGKVVLLDFWATWCGPCLANMPSVQNLWQHYRSKDFVVLGVSLDDSPEAWKKYVAQPGFDWVHVGDARGWDNAVAMQYNVNEIPRTFLLDKNGVIVGINIPSSMLPSMIDRELAR